MPLIHYILFSIYLPNFSLMAQNNGSCGPTSVGYSPWGPSQYVENFYNNPIQYPTNGSSTNVHCFPNHQPSLQNTNGTSCYPQHQTTKSCHSHYPPNHAHSVEYQPYHSNNGINRKCGSTRMCSSYDALISPQQPLHPNPAGWVNNSQLKSNGVGGGGHKCSKQNSQQQLYQCSSECSDHSLKSHSQHSQHSQHSHSSQERSSRNSNCKESCHQRSSSQTNKHHSTHTAKITNHGTTNGNDILNGNGNNDNIYENDEETTEHDRMITSNSDCCSSAGEIDGDSSCCSCSLYAEAGEPSQSVSNNQLSKVTTQN